MTQLSERIQSVQPSATVTISNRAKELKLEGRDIVALSAGEPDFGAPETARQEGIRAIREGFTHYTLTAGILSLRQAICDRFQKDFDLHYDPDQIVVGSGAKSVLFHLFQILLNPGDEVIIFAPYWVSYPDQVRLAGGQPIIVKTKESQEFVPQPEDLERALSKNTRLILLNAPANPSGACLERKDLGKLGEVVQNHPNVMVISDEIYAHIVFDGFRQESIAAVVPEIKEQCIVVNGMSKAYAMTGWRIGYAAGPQVIINALKKIQGQSTSNASSIAQRASLGALTGDQGVIHEMVQKYQERRNHTLKRLEEIPGIKCLKPRGAFYCFPNVSSYFGLGTSSGKTIGDSFDLASYLIEDMGVAVVPGVPFGAPENIRLSFATSLSQLDKGIDRLRQGFENLK